MSLKDYETVKERKKRFYADYPDGSLVVEMVKHENSHVLMRGYVFKTKEDQEKGLPTGTGYAEEFQGEGGFANKHSWTENCDESAIGRALDNAGYSGNNKCSKEEIDKVLSHEEQSQYSMLSKQINESKKQGDLDKVGDQIKSLHEKGKLSDKAVEGLRALYGMKAKTFKKSA